VSMRALMRWIFIFSAVCVALFTLGYGLMWALGLFSGLGVHGTIAAVLGVFLTTAIGMALMALIFYSNRSGFDASVHHLADKSHSSAETEPRQAQEPKERH
jgi:hypothetical protein